MEQKQTSPAVKGIIISLIVIVFSLIVQFTGQSGNKLLGVLNMAIFCAGIIWACLSYSKELNANITYGNAFAHGFKVAAAVTAIVVVYTFLAVKFITPGMVDTAIDNARKKMEEKNTMTQDQVEAALEMTRKYFLPFAIGGVILVYLFCGLIFSLIGAAIAKKNPNAGSPFQE
jgi:hypothetical protein